MSDFVNAEYEKSVLGSMLIDNECIDDVIGKITREQFAIPSHKELFDAIKVSYLENKFVNILSLQSKLKDIDTTYIATLTDVGTAAQVNFYVEQLQKLYLARQMRAKLCEEVEKLSPDNVMATVHELDSSLMDYMGMDKVNTFDIKELIPSFIEELQKPLPSDRTLLGYDSGIETLNDIIDGIQQRKMIIVGARPSIGKSALALNIASNVAMNENIPVSLFSFEMPKEELMIRLASSVSNVPAYNIEHKIFSSADVGRINQGMGKLFNTDFRIYDRPIDNELKLFSMIRQQAKQGVKVFIIDHLGLIRHSDHSIKRFEAVHDITIRLHDLAKELNVAIVVLCQLKRDAEGKRPTLSDLRESGDIEQDADVIIFIHRERAMNNEIEIEAELIVEKNRGGSTGVAKTIFYPRTTKFVADLTEKKAA